MNQRALLVSMCLGLFAFTAAGKELELQGKASLQIPQSTSKEQASTTLQTLRVRAVAAAKRDAARAAVEKVLGPNASKDPHVSNKLDAVVDQIRDDQIVDTKSTRIGDSYEVVVRLVLDDREFRGLLSDLGIAVNTSTVRGYSILAVMDEFLSTPRDIRAPVEELEEFSSEKGASFVDKSRAFSGAFKSSSSANAAVGTLDAARSAKVTVTGANDQQRGEGASSANVSASMSASSAKSSVSEASTRLTNDVEAKAQENVRYKKLIKYQPLGASPERVSQTYNALVGQLQDYDLRVLDNDVFRSRHFRDAPLTIDQMQSGEALSKYVGWARAEATADFFLVGNAITIDLGKNANTGDSECTGVVTLKTYSTLDGESVASETVSERAAGHGFEDCGAALAKKLARITGSIIGARVQDYWKRRNTYGREYVVTLTGDNLPLMVRAAFTRAIKGLPGVENDTQRSAGPKQVQIVVTYKGSEPLDQALAMSLAGNQAFATLDSKSEGNQLLMCLGPCAATVAASGTAKQ